MHNTICRCAVTVRLLVQSYSEFQYNGENTVFIELKLLYSLLRSIQKFFSRIEFINFINFKVF